MIRELEKQLKREQILLKRFHTTSRNIHSKVYAQQDKVKNLEKKIAMLKVDTTILNQCFMSSPLSMAKVLEIRRSHEEKVLKVLVEKLHINHTFENEINQVSIVREVMNTKAFKNKYPIEIDKKKYSKLYSQIIFNCGFNKEE